ncbi:MAG: hypothetical protein EAZ16_11475, partial [Sphingobacteriales bacterium]
MRIAKPFAATLVVVLFLYACNRNVVNLDYTNAKDEVPQLGNLVFRFNKPLVKDSLLNQWDSTEYIRFEPAIPGRFRWEHPDELVFSPARPLAPATNYKAVFSKELLRFSKADKIGKADDVLFYTPDLKLENTNIIWTLADAGSKTAVPQVDLYFNYPVDPNSLKDKLAVQLDGKEADYSLLTMNADSKVSLRLLNMKTEDRDYNISITLNKGLLPKDGKNGLKEAAETKAIIPSPFVLTINDVNTEHDGSIGIITVRTSQQIASQNLAGFIKIDPAVKYSTEITDDGFTISSDAFDADKSYELQLGKGLRGIIGGTLKEAYSNTIAFGKMEPGISFANSKAIYLAGQGAKNIEIKITNVPKVKIIVSKIYENNLLQAQQNGYYPQESSSSRYNDEYYEDDYANTVSGDVIYEKEIDTRSLPKLGGSRLFNFNIEDRLPEFKGIYHIKIRSAEDYWVSDSRFISLSDLGVIAKEGTDNITVFINSIKTANPLSGVNVVAYGNNNQLLGNASTDNDGKATIAYTRRDLKGFKPAMIIAKTEKDFTYLPFNSTKVNTSRFEVGGKRSNTTGLDAFIYAERDIYRPGERVNFSVVVRDKQWKSPGELPVKLKFLLPNGKELKTLRKSLNEQGAVEGNIDIAAAAITGTYVLEIYNGNDVLLGSSNFMIEEFVPDRIKVTTQLNKNSFVPGDIARLSINAVNFFGPPAANRNYENEVQIKKKDFSAKKYSRYNFSVANESVSFDKTMNEGKTDEAGNAYQEFKVKDEYKNTGLLQATFYATVFDETGRPVSRSKTADIFTQPVFFGIANDGWWYYPLNQAIQFPLIAVNAAEQLSNGQAKVEVIKHEYRTVLTKVGDYFRYESQQEDKLVASTLINISGENTNYAFTPRSPGNYEIRVAVPGAASYVKK